MKKGEAQVEKTIQDIFSEEIVTGITIQRSSILSRLNTNFSSSEVRRLAALMKTYMRGPYSEPSEVPSKRQMTSLCGDLKDIGGLDHKIKLILNSIFFFHLLLRRSVMEEEGKARVDDILVEWTKDEGYSLNYVTSEVEDGRPHVNYMEVGYNNSNEEVILSSDGDCVHVMVRVLRYTTYSSNRARFKRAKAFDISPLLNCPSSELNIVSLYYSFILLLSVNDYSVSNRMSTSVMKRQLATTKDKMSEVLPKMGKFIEGLFSEGGKWGEGDTGTMLSGDDGLTFEISRYVGVPEPEVSSQVGLRLSQVDLKNMLDTVGVGQGRLFSQLSKALYKGYVPTLTSYKFSLTSKVLGLNVDNLFKIPHDNELRINSMIEGVTWVNLNKLIVKFMGDREINQNVIKQTLYKIICDAYPSFEVFDDENLDFSIVEGEEIGKIYTEGYEQKGRLGNSCMRYSKCEQRLSDFYGSNPEQVKLAVVKNKDSGLTVSRCLLWFPQETNEVLMDTVYSSREIDEMVKSKIREEYSDREVVDLKSGSLKRGYKVTLSNFTFRSVPYLDTLVYLDTEGNLYNRKGFEEYLDSFGYVYNRKNPNSKDVCDKTYPLLKRGAICLLSSNYEDGTDTRLAKSWKGLGFSFISDHTGRVSDSQSSTFTRDYLISRSAHIPEKSSITKGIVDQILSELHDEPF